VTDLPPPPHEIRWLTDVIGVEAALTLFEKSGGVLLYVPAAPKEDSPLAKLIGFEAAKALGRIKGGENIKPPLAKLWRTRVYHARGMSQADIARRLGIDASTVSRHLRPIVSHFAQMSMFD
jgi:hypothetical protein